MHFNKKVGIIKLSPFMTSKVFPLLKSISKRNLITFVYFTNYLGKIYWE